MLQTAACPGADPALLDAGEVLYFGVAETGVCEELDVMPRPPVCGQAQS
jgi:hypothetical protein